LVKQFRVEKPVKYFMDTTMKRLTGVDATYIPSKLSPKHCDTNLTPEDDLPCTEEHPVVDWKNTFLWHNSHKSEEFNYLKAPLILTEEQITYCLNLVRYCGDTEFARSLRLQ
jgi:hypothetical protein